MFNSMIVKLALKKRGMKQIDLAHRLGKSDSEISKWLTGKRQPEPSTVYRIAQILELRIEDLYDTFPLAVAEQKVKYRSSPPIEIAGKVNGSIVDTWAWTLAGTPSADGCMGYIYTDVCDPDAFALDVQDNSLEPRFSIGDRLIISPNAPFTKSGEGVFFIRAKEKAYVKRISPVGEGRLVLEPLNCKDASILISESEVVSIWPVVQTIYTHKAF